MRHPLFRTWSLLTLACALTAPASAQPVANPAPPPTAVPLALVIGNSAYTALPPLPACELSANLTAATLTRAGFKVAKTMNPSNAQMGAALATLADRVAEMPAGRAVVYYCGYISSYAERLFALPVDAKLDRDTDVLTQGIVARLLMSAAVGPASTAGLVAMDYTPAPNQVGAPVFSSMLRPADEAHGALAAAPFRTTASPVTGPLASALPDLLSAVPVELQQSLRALAARPDLAGATIRAPVAPSVLLGGSTATPPPSPSSPAPLHRPGRQKPPPTRPWPSPTWPTGAESSSRSSFSASSTAA